jgi:hypothetical protein
MCCRKKRTTQSYVALNKKRMLQKRRITFLNKFNRCLCIFFVLYTVKRRKNSLKLILIPAPIYICSANKSTNGSNVKEITVSETRTLGWLSYRRQKVVLVR